MKNNVVPFPRQHQGKELVYEQACIWLSKLDSQIEESAVLREQLDLWLAEDPLHIEIFLEMAELWDQLGVLSELSEIFPLSRYAPLPEKVTGRRNFLAAGFAVLLSAIGIGMFALNDANNYGIEEKISSYETLVGEQLEVMLPDGSEIVLNTNTLIEVSYTDSERNIILQRGEGLFTVARDEQRPFRVYAGTRVIEAVGTAFNVLRTGDEDIEVIVTEGRVRLFPAVATSSIEEYIEILEPASTSVQRDEVLLVAGDYITAQHEQLTEAIQVNQIETEEIETRLAWRHGMLLFQGDSLEKVIEVISRYTTIKIEADSSVKDIPVEGYFRARDIDGLLISIANNFQIDVQRINDDYILLTSQ